MMHAQVLSCKLYSAARSEFGSRWDCTPEYNVMRGNTTYEARHAIDTSRAKRRSGGFRSTKATYVAAGARTRPLGLSGHAMRCGVK